MRRIAIVVVLAALGCAGFLMVGKAGSAPRPRALAACPSNAVGIDGNFQKATQTLSWLPVANATGYALCKDGVQVSTAGPGATSARFGTTAGHHTLDYAPLFPNPPPTTTGTTTVGTTTTTPTTTATVPTTTATVPTTTTTPTTTVTPPPAGVTPPTPPQPYIIPFGAVVLADGTYSGMTISADTYAQNLGGAVINGNVNLVSGSLHGVVVNGTITIDSNNAPGVVTDSWVHAQGNSWGVHIYRPDGLDLERLVVDGFTNVGVRASDNNGASGATIKRLWDLKIRGGNQGGATGGTGEVALWVGHPVAEGVQRVDLSGGYITELWTGNAAANTTFSDVRAENDVGLDTAMYQEHESTNLTFNRFLAIAEPAADRVDQCEYRASFTTGACHTILFDGGTVQGGHTGFDLEDAQNVTITNTKFVGQDARGVYCLRCTGFSQTNNDFTGMAPGTPPVVTSG